MSNGYGEVDIQICHQTIELEFQDITFTRNKKYGQSSKKIIKGVSGRFRPGRLTAVLGPSGAGKTSLLNILAGFRTLGVKGSVRVNGKERILQTFRKECCYITQEFSMLELLTVRETFKSTADFKLGNKVSDEKKLSIISGICSILGLSESMNTHVKYLSGGEKKRLSIGVELITNPPLMFFDEPTSGLDSSSSVQIITHLKALASGGRTIVCVIHQPSSKIFEIFDDVYIVADGRCLYSGTVDNMVPVLGNSGFKCPKYYNRADFAIEVACKEREGNLKNLFEQADKNAISSNEQEVLNQTSIEERELQNHSYLNEPFELKSYSDHSKGKDSRSTKKKHTTVQITPMDQSKSNKTVKKYPTSTLFQFWVLLKRTLLCTCIRDLYVAQIRYFSQISVGLIMGIVFYNVGNEASKIQSGLSYVFFSLAFIFFSNAMPTVQTFPSEAAVVFKEHLNNWYSMKAYYFSKIIADLPFQIINPITYFLVTYYMTDQPWDRLGMVLLIGFLTTLMAQALGEACGAAFNAQLGTFLVPASAIPMLLFSGFFVHLSDLPFYIQWLSWISYFRYPFEGLMLATYGYGRPNLECSEPYCHYRKPSKLLEFMDLENGNFWIDVAGISVWIIFLRIALYGILKYRLYRIRGY